MLMSQLRFDGGDQLDQPPHPVAIFRPPKKGRVCVLKKALSVEADPRPPLLLDLIRTIVWALINPLLCYCSIL